MSRVRSVRAWGPSTGPTACALAGRRCSLWGWRKSVPGGGCLPPLLGASEVTRRPFPNCPPTGRAVGVRHPRAVGTGVWVWGPNTVPLGCMPCGGCVPRGSWGAVPGGGWPATVVRDVRCQALFLPWPPVLWRGHPGFRDPCVPGAVGAGVGTQHRPHSVRPCRPALLAVGAAEGVPGGAAFDHSEGCLRSGAVPPRTARPLGGLLGSATHVLWVRVCGCGGPTVSPWPACPVGAACRGGGGGPSPGGMACHRYEGRLVSGAVPPPAARPLERAARVPRPVCPGCGQCGRGDPAPAPLRAPLRAGVARCGAGGRASPGGLPSAVVRGVWGQAPPLPRLPALWEGCRGSLARCCGHGCGCVRYVWCLCGACRGARCRSSLVPLVLPSPVLQCDSLLTVFLPCPLPCARPLLGCWPPPVSFLASLLFTLSSTLLPGMHFFPASALVRVSVFFLAGSSFSLVGPCETKEGWGYVGLRRLGAVIM